MSLSLSLSLSLYTLHPPFDVGSAASLEEEEKRSDALILPSELSSTTAKQETVGGNLATIKLLDEANYIFSNVHVCTYENYIYS